MCRSLLALVALALADCRSAPWDDATSEAIRPSAPIMWSRADSGKRFAIVQRHGGGLQPAPDKYPNPSGSYAFLETAELAQ